VHTRADAVNDLQTGSRFPPLSLGQLFFVRGVTVSQSLVSPVLVIADPGWTDLHGKSFLHWCPGCECMHLINIEKPNKQGAQWTFDGNLDAPTFSPSINYPGYCHYFVRAGKIEFLGDCKHKLAGQTVPMPSIPEEQL